MGGGLRSRVATGTIVTTNVDDYDVTMIRSQSVLVEMGEEFKELRKEVSESKSFMVADVPTNTKNVLCYIIYVDLGFAAPLTSEEATICPAGKKNYIPHQPVFNLNKPGKCRIVFDASFRFKGSSSWSRLLSRQPAGTPSPFPSLRIRGHGQRGENVPTG